MKDTPQTWDEDDDGDEDDDDESQQDAFVTDCDNGNVKEKNSLSVRSLPNPKTVIYACACIIVIPNNLTTFSQCTTFPYLHQ